MFHPRTPQNPSGAPKAPKSTDKRDSSKLLAHNASIFCSTILTRHPLSALGRREKSHAVDWRISGGVSILNTNGRVFTKTRDGKVDQPHGGSFSNKFPYKSRNEMISA